MLQVTAFAGEPVRKTWTVSGVERVALAALPEKTESAPLVFYFHGRGGKVAEISKRHAIHLPTYVSPTLVTFFKEHRRRE